MAAIELNIISHMFQISDQSISDSKEQLSIIITDKEEKIFQVSIMIARSLNTVKISPNAYFLDSYSN